ncbi:hypothetical protein AGMMS49992_34020 [Clostridia bacterium]|nr:hypothetical protein AGMMS49992_34020 [Clostridia bacterium]
MPNNYRVVISYPELNAVKVLTAKSQDELTKKVSQQKEIWKKKLEKNRNMQTQEEMRQLAEEQNQQEQTCIESLHNLLSNALSDSASTNIDWSFAKDKAVYPPFSFQLPMPIRDEEYKNIVVPERTFMEIFSKKKRNARDEALALYYLKRDESEAKFKAAGIERDQIIADKLAQYKVDESAFYKAQETELDNFRASFYAGTPESIVSVGSAAPIV